MVHFWSSLIIIRISEFTMNKTLAITAFAFVAVIMGLSAVAPAIVQNVFADHGPEAETCEKILFALENGNFPLNEEITPDKIKELCHAGED